MSQSLPTSPNIADHKLKYWSVNLKGVLEDLFCNPTCFAHHRKQICSSDELTSKNTIQVFVDYVLMPDTQDPAAKALKRLQWEKRSTASKAQFASNRNNRHRTKGFQWFRENGEQKIRYISKESGQEFLQVIIWQWTKLSLVKRKTRDVKVNCKELMNKNVSFLGNCSDVFLGE